MYAILLRFPNAVNVYKSLIDLIRAFKHDTGIVHIVPLPVAQLRVRASFLQVRRLADHQLAQLVHEEALLPGQ